WEHDPSVGLLLKFTGDMVTLVLIHGSNLDTPTGTAAVNLTDRGFQRHRVTWVREMDEDELRRGGEGGATHDANRTGAAQTAEQQQEWLRRHAPAFLRREWGVPPVDSGGNPG